MDFPADRRPDPIFTDLLERGGRIGFLESDQKHSRLTLRRLNLQRFGATADGAHVGHVDRRHAVRLGDFPDLARINLLLEANPDLVAAGEIDAVDVVALVDDDAHPEQHHQPRADESRLTPFDEIHINVLQQVVHRELLHPAGLDEHLHDEVSGDQHRAKGRNNTDRQSHTEALDRALAEPDHDGANDELHRVGIENGPERLVIPALVGRSQALAGREFFAHALEDQDVGIDRHTDRQNDTCEARERHRRPEAGHDAEDDQDVDRQGSHRDQSARRIKRDHKRRDERGADDRRTNAAIDRVLGERRTDFVLFFDHELDREWVVEHVRELDGFTVRHIPATDLGGLAVDLLLDRGRGIKFAVEDNREATYAPGLLATIRDRPSHFRKAGATFLGKIHHDLGLAVNVRPRA